MVLVMEFSVYVLRRLPPPPLRILEIGCGDQGGVTPALVAAGYDVLAIDPRAPEGPNYRRITLEELEPEPFDAVVAGRVLHHVTPLEPALSKLAGLAPLLIADEFAWNLIDTGAQRWYERLYQERCDAGSDPTGPQDLDTWRWRHADLHSSETLQLRLDEVCETVELEWRPYLYHWLGAETEASSNGRDRRRRAARDRVPLHVSDPRLASPEVNSSGPEPKSSARASGISPLAVGSIVRPAQWAPTSSAPKGIGWIYIIGPTAVQSGLCSPVSTHSCF